MCSIFTAIQAQSNAHIPLHCLHRGMSQTHVLKSPGTLCIYYKACRGGRLVEKRWLNDSKAAGSLAAVSWKLEADWYYLFSAPKQGLSSEVISPKLLWGCCTANHFMLRPYWRNALEKGVYVCLKAIHSHSVTLCILLHFQLNLKCKKKPSHKTNKRGYYSGCIKLWMHMRKCGTQHDTNTHCHTSCPQVTHPIMI